MIVLNSEQKKLAVEILSEAFIANKSVRTIVKHTSCIPELMSYCFDKSYQQGLAFANDELSAFALCTMPHLSSVNLQSLVQNIRLIRKAVGLKKVPLVVKREKLIHAQHPKHDYIHLEFLGVNPQTQGSGVGTKFLNDIKQFALSQNCPIYLETSTEINIAFYKKNDFTKFCTIPTNGYNLHFFRYN